LLRGKIRKVSQGVVWEKKKRIDTWRHLGILRKVKLAMGGNANLFARGKAQGVTCWEGNDSGGTTENTILTYQGKVGEARRPRK